MSTTPGDDTWADAGLVPPDSSEVQDPSRSTVPVEAEHQPAAPRPDLRDEASEPDVVEQAQPVPEDETDDYPSGE